MSRALLAITAASAAVALGFPIACGGCGAPEERVAADAGAGHAPVDGGLDAEMDAPDTGPVVAGACGPIGPWGPWPPEDAAARSPVVWAPAFERPDCGPGCWLVTTRWNDNATASPHHLAFSGSLLTQAPTFGKGVVVNLDAREEYEGPGPAPEPGVSSSSAALSGDCLIQVYYYYDDATVRDYACESCLFRDAYRGLRFAESPPEAPDVADVMTADGTFALFGGGIDEQGNGRGLWALDLRDGSRHKFASSSWLVWNVSLAAPYIVLSEGDGEVHLIDTRDWSDTNVTNHPALQYMAASDGRTIVWVDQRFHEGGTLENPANQEVVAYDIASGTMQRLTYTTDDAPSAKFNPAVEGDWVVWEDDRDSNNPNAPYGSPGDRMDIYGFNLATADEYHVLGNQAGTLPESIHGPHGLMPYSPRLHRGKLYVRGALDLDGDGHVAVQVWEFDMPEP